MLKQLHASKLQRPHAPQSVSADDHLASIMANSRWLGALNSWYADGARPRLTITAPFDLPLGSWQALQEHLIGTGMFGVESEKITPLSEGKEFLSRINELKRAIARNDREDKVVSQILCGIPRGAAVDIGCGPGHSALRLVSMGYHPVFAYDLSPVAVKVAQAFLGRQNKELYLFERDATELSEVESDSLQLIFSRGAFHYFFQPKLANSIKRTLRPGGYVVAELIGLHYYLQLDHFRSLFDPRKRWHLLSYTRTVLRTFLYEVFAVQSQLGAAAPEIGYTRHNLKRFAEWADLEILSISPAPASVGYLVVMRKPSTDAH
jgi:SAM-dependent methyltransferase